MERFIPWSCVLCAVKISDLFWVPGDMCCALFVLTKDEYDMKDSDPAALEVLTQKLYQNILKDRLLEAYYLNMQHQRKEMRLPYEILSGVWEIK